MNSSERRAWKAFENVCGNFLGNKKVENYSEIMQELTSSYSVIGCNIQTSFFAFPFGFFPLKTWEQSPMNMVKVSIRIFSKWKRGTVDYGVQICWLTAVAVL
jgi:hypothetical protein